MQRFNDFKSGGSSFQRDRSKEAPSSRKKDFDEGSRLRQIDWATETLSKF